MKCFFVKDALNRLLKDIEKNQQDLPDIYSRRSIPVQTYWVLRESETMM